MTISIITQKQEKCAMYTRENVLEWYVEENYDCDYQNNTVTWQNVKELEYLGLWVHWIELSHHHN